MSERLNGGSPDRGAVPVYRLLVAALLFVAVAPLPYAYYRFLRLAVCAAAVYSAWEEFQSGVRLLGWLFVVIGVLFNPLAPVHLDRSVWFWIDLGAGGLFAISATSKLRAGRAAEEHEHKSTGEPKRTLEKDR